MPHEGGHGGAQPPMPPAAQPPQMPGEMPMDVPAGGSAEGRGDEPEGRTRMQVDPVCRMQVDPSKAHAEGLFTEIKGATWFFDSAECKRKFDADPAVYLPTVR